MLNLNKECKLEGIKDSRKTEINRTPKVFPAWTQGTKNVSRLWKTAIEIQGTNK